MQRNPGNNNYIIGGGITGLVWNYYHPEYKIITPESSGESFTRTYMVWLHDTLETRKLLTDLGLEVKPKKSLIGYYSKGLIRDYISPEMSRRLIQKKMADWDGEIDTSFDPKTQDMSLSKAGGNTYLLTLDVDLNEVIRRLNEKATIIPGYVSMITSDTIVVRQTPIDQEYQTYPYDNMVSTIAAPFFWKAYMPNHVAADGSDVKSEDFKCSPITNIVTSVKPKDFDDRYEMVYYDESRPYSRVSHLEGKYALEFTGIVPKEKFEEMFPELPVDDYFVVKQGRIFENEENHPPNENITFSGRFSQWRYGITTEHVVKQALDY